MLFELPVDDVLYQALLERDETYEGRAFVCVHTTGIFCRLTCSARKPKRENCSFYGSVSDCIEAGYRPCKKCHPTSGAAIIEPLVQQLLGALEGQPQKRWTEQDLMSMGMDPSTVRRTFKRSFGMTFLEMARQRRLKDGFDMIGKGEKVISAQLEANFDSASGFRQAFAKLLGCAPGDLKSNADLLADWISTPLGDMITISSKDALLLLEFVERKALAEGVRKLIQELGKDIGIGSYEPTLQIRSELQAYFDGQCPTFTTPLKLHGTDFYCEVWNALRRIPAGETFSYSELAAEIGRPKAVRAVARANSSNRLALAVPCHRVIGADGTLTGYAGGLWRKQKLLEIERLYRSDQLPRPSFSSL